MLKDNRAVTSRIVESSLSVETGATAVPTITDTNKRGYTWRIDLATTESHWKGWFQGLSSLFLSSPVQSSILAGTSPVGQELTRQRKYPHALPGVDTWCEDAT